MRLPLMPWLATPQAALPAFRRRASTSGRNGDWRFEWSQCHPRLNRPAPRSSCRAPLRRQRRKRRRDSTVWVGGNSLAVKSPAARDNRPAARPDDRCTAPCPREIKAQRQVGKRLDRQVNRDQRATAPTGITGGGLSSESQLVHTAAIHRAVGTHERHRGSADGQRFAAVLVARQRTLRRPPPALRCSTCGSSGYSPRRAGAQRSAAALANAVAAQLAIHLRRGWPIGKPRSMHDE
jgi:hypothetical protein